jgi:hypothetical protein
VKPINDRVHALLDGELPSSEARSLRDELRRSPDACLDLDFLEQALVAARRNPPPLPEGFEARVMARIAAAPPPRRSRLGWLTTPRFRSELSWATVLLLVAAVALLIGLALWAGFRAGLAAGAKSSSSRETPQQVTRAADPPAGSPL